MNGRCLVQHQMDVLIKEKLAPPTLLKQCLQCLAQFIKNYIKSAMMKDLDNKNLAYVRKEAEKSLQVWFLPVCVTLKRQLLDHARQLDTANKAFPNSRTPSVEINKGSGENSAAVFLASLLGILYDPLFERCTLFEELQWSRDCRLQVLYLLSERSSKVRELLFLCYRAKEFSLKQIQFSEKYALAKSWMKFPHLKVLVLPNVCDDEMLKKVGECCPLLEELDVSGSYEVTNDGIEWLLKSTAPEVTFRKLIPAKSKINVSKRVGYVATSFSGCCANKINRVRDNLGSKREDDRKRATMCSLRRLDLTNTAVNAEGLELIITTCKALRVVSVDDPLWSSFFATLTDDGSGCIDCIGVSPNVTFFNMINNVEKYLSIIKAIFPNVQHLFFNILTEESTEWLPSFENHTSLSLRDLNRIDLRSSLEVCGWRLQRLDLNCKSTVINIILLDDLCPNLESLNIIGCHLTLGDLQHHKINQKRFRCLRLCQLWEVQQISDHWKILLQWSLNLRALCLWNIPISDGDLQDIFFSNSFEYLEDLRIGASEIGFVRLTEKSCTKIFETCKNLKKIGGLCDWNFSDMCEMMKVLTLRKGWKLKLHPLIMYNAF